ncbi:MAG: hypothetical protein ACI8ZT_000363, partial [Bacteroidia bacterium]
MFTLSDIQSRAHQYEETIIRRLRKTHWVLVSLYVP